MNQLAAAGAADNGITIDLRTVDSAVSAVFPSNSGIFDKTQSLTVLLPAAGITFDSNALKTLGASANGGTVTVGADQVPNSSLTPTQQAAVGDRPVYDLTVLAGGGTVLRPWRDGNGFHSVHPCPGRAADRYPDLVFERQR